MNCHSVVFQGARLGATLLGLSVGACSGETRVSLLTPSIAADAAAQDAAGAPNSTSLIHRFSFTGQSREAIDSIGGADGTLENGAVLDGAGHVVLDGADDFVDLPDGLISGLDSATLVGWLSWNGGRCWQRVFDFGSNDGSSDGGEVGNATTSVFATPLRCPELGPAAAFELNEAIVGAVDGFTPFPVLQNTSLAVVLDPPTEKCGCTSPERG